MLNTINQLPEIICDPFNHIATAHYNNGAPQVPSQKERAQIMTDIARMNLTGKMALGGGIIGIVISGTCLNLPYIGPLLRLTGTITSIAIFIFGYDTTKISDNLHNFTQRASGNVASNFLNTFFQGSKTAEENFKTQLLTHAVQKTLITGPIVNYYIYSKDT